MAVYKIADINIKINCHGNYLKNLLKNYRCDYAECDFEVVATDNDIQAERIIASGFTDEMYESSAVLRKISGKILADYDEYFFTELRLNINQRHIYFVHRQEQAKQHTLCSGKRL